MISVLLLSISSERHPGKRRRKTSPTALSMSLRRKSRWHFSDFVRMKQKLSGYFRTAESRREEFKILASGITRQDLAKTYPRAEVHTSWDELIRATATRYGEGPCKVVLYRCAPFLIPTERPPMASTTGEKARGQQ